LVKLTNGQARRKLTGAGILGTPDYMPPEQAMELPNVDHRSDIWSMCVVLYEALSGALPFSGPTFAETLCAVVQCDPAPLTAIGVDQELWHIIERGLRKKPQERWASMRDLGNELATWLVDRGVTVDVTGASLHTQWSVARADVPAPVALPAPPKAASAPFAASLEDPPRRAMRSGLRLRHDAQRISQRRVGKSPPEPRRAPPPRGNAAAIASIRRFAVRWAMASAVASIALLAPIPEGWIRQAEAWMTLLPSIDRAGAEAPNAAPAAVHEPQPIASP
jgi:serine/threonine-protein kinase